MMMRRAFAITVFTVLVLGLGVAAHADILAAGAMYGGPTQTVAACYLYNAGTGPVTIVTNQIFREAGGAIPAISLPLVTDQCGVTLAPNTICVIAANIVSNAGAHACKFVISPSAANVRGGFEVRAAGNVVLRNVDLR